MFSNILYYCANTDTEVSALANTLVLADLFDARVTLLCVYPVPPKDLAGYVPLLEASLRQANEKKIAAALARAQLADRALTLDIEIRACNHGFVEAVRQVQTGGYQLVVKESARTTPGDQAKSVDMSLVRKCPCPVLLFAADGKPLRESRLAIAVNPNDGYRNDPSGHAFALQLLQTAAALGKALGKPLQVLACYDTTAIEMVNRLSLSRMNEDEILNIDRQLQKEHLRALQELVGAAGLTDATLVQLKGHPREKIPAEVAKRGIDCLIMGSVARTGIPGFLIGNTAEDIIAQMPASMLTVKPQDFVSPIKAP